MRIIGRIVLILLTSAATAGSIYLLAKGSALAFKAARPFGNHEGSDRHDRGIHSRFPGELTPADSGRRGIPPSDFPSRGHRLEGRFSPGRGVLGIIRSLAVIAMITIAVTRTKIGNLIRS